MNQGDELASAEKGHATHLRASTDLQGKASGHNSGWAFFIGMLTSTALGKQIVRVACMQERSYMWESAK